MSGASTFVAKPFTLSIPDTALADLQNRLKLTRLPNTLADAGRERGSRLEDIKRLVARWTDGFDWRAFERDVNTLPMFTAPVPVDGFGSLNIHFVHQKSSVPNAIPLLFVHGWPGSFIEVKKILPLLTQVDGVDAPSFHVVAIGLPGYGFSEGPNKTGFRGAQYAEICNNLMLLLGYNEYVVQGGDWGQFVARWLAKQYGATSVKAWHTNMPIGTRPTDDPEDVVYTDQEKAGLERTEWFDKNGSGYIALQSTRPHTLAYALADSPAGLLAWIYEKLVDWSDSYPWTDDEVLQWTSIYWHSVSGPGASLNIYYEMLQSGDHESFGVPDVPFGVSFFPKDIFQVPARWLEKNLNVVFKSYHESGGHFAAHERPEELVSDIRQMFGRGGPAYGVVSGKPGYT